MLKDGKLNAYWIQVNNNLQAAPNTDNETYPGYRNPENFIVVSDAYPTVTAMAADLILPDGDVGREGGRLRQRRAPHAFLAPARRRARRGALRPLAADGVLEALHDRRGLAGRVLDKNPEYRGKTLYEVLYANGQVDQFPLSQIDPEYENAEAKHFGFYVQKGLFEEYAALRARPWPRPCAVRHVSPGPRPALAGGERQGDALALPGGPDPYVKEGSGFHFYGNPDGKARLSSRVPYEPPRRSARPGISTSGW